MVRRRKTSTHTPVKPLLITALTLLVGLAFIAGALLLREWRTLVVALNPIAVPPVTLLPQDVDPRYTLPLLTDRPPAVQIREALRAQKATTAYTILRWDSTTPPGQRLGLLRALVEAPTVGESLRMNAARQMYLTAVLHPLLSDGERLDTLVYLLEKWAAWEHVIGVKETARSIKALLNTSPNIRALQRQEALEALQRAGVGIDDVHKPPLGQSGAYKGPRLTLPPPPPALPLDVYRAQEERIRRARMLAQDPGDVQAREHLAGALRVEDLARENFYTHALASHITPYEQMVLSWDQMRWRTWRLLIASRLFGLSLVPEWESRTGEFEFALIKSWERFVASAADMMAAQPDLLQARQGMYELWTWIAWAGENRLYPRYPQLQVWESLKHSQAIYKGSIGAPPGPWIQLDERPHPPWYILTSGPKR